MKYLLTIILICYSFSEVLAEEKKIALLYPNNTISLSGENADGLIDNYYRWELFLIQNKYKFDVFTDEQLGEGLSNDYSLLLVPSAKRLSESEINSVKEFMENGNSVLATMNAGVYDIDGKWIGWRTLEDLFGLSSISEIQPQVPSKIHSLFGNIHLSKDIPPGFRLQVTTDEKPIEAKINSKNTYPVGYWQNSEIPFEGKLNSDYTTSIVYGNYGKGKFVWLGFELSAIVGAKTHQVIANQLIKNSIDWLTNRIIVQIETWPKAKQSAVVLSCDVEFKFTLINNLLDLLEDENLPAHFYILTESIDSSSLQRLMNKGDIGLHGDDHNSFRFQNYDTQFRRLADGITILENLTGRKPNAFRPPETYYDNVTLDALSAHNISILSADFIEDRAVPQFLTDYPHLLIIPKTGFDDYDIFLRLKLLTAEEQSKRYVLDFNRTYEEGSLFNLNIHTQMQCQPEFVGALKGPIQAFKSHDVWLTTHSGIYDWWNKKSKLKISETKTDEKTFIVEVENTGELQIEDLVISLYKNNFMDFFSSKIMIDGISIDFTSNANLNKICIPLPNLSPREKKRITIEFF